MYTYAKRYSRPTAWSSEQARRCWSRSAPCRIADEQRREARIAKSAAGIPAALRSSALTPAGIPAIETDVTVWRLAEHLDHLDVLRG